MSEKIGNVANIWWEDEHTFDLLRSFRRVCFASLTSLWREKLILPSQDLYYPLVEKYGYDYSDADSADVKQLRTLAIGGGAAIDDPR